MTNETFYRVKVEDIRQETIDTVTLLLDAPKNLKPFLAYKSGQYLSFKANINNREEIRSYSISSCHATEEFIALTVKKVPNGIVSTYINEEIEIGQYIEISSPRGLFLKREAPAHVFFAGGSGIAPIYSIIKQLLSENADAKILLVYTAQYCDQIIFYDEIEDLAANHSYFKIEYFITRDDYAKFGNFGREEEDDVKRLAKEFCGSLFRFASFYVCGPYDKMQMELRALKEAGVHETQIVKELFYKPKDESEENENKKRVSSLRAKLYGEVIETEVRGGYTITEALRLASAEPPASCMIGSCAVCRAKLVKGEVACDFDDSLTDEEKELGFILTCRAEPTTEVCEVDFDV
jgi:ring-1,2-phenylacetyl-CoA epoxidase subunit PaaE